MDNIPDYYIDNDGLHHTDSNSESLCENSSSREPAAANTTIAIRYPLSVDAYIQSMDRIYLAILSNNM